MNKNIEKLLSAITDWIIIEMTKQHGSFNERIFEIKKLYINSRILVFTYNNIEYKIQF